MSDLPEGIIRTPEGVHVLETDSHLSIWVREQGKLDIAEGQIAFYAQFISKGGGVLDAGACIGDHTATYAKLVGPGGRVWALEPNPLSFQALRLNFEGQENVIPLNMALGEVPGFAKMHHEVNAGASFLTPDGDIPVKAATIDGLPLTRLDLIHLDCEGSEPAALRGARATLARFRPVIVLEIAHKCLERYGMNEPAVLRLLGELGYTWQEIEPHHGPHLPNRDIIAFPNK